MDKRTENFRKDYTLPTLTLVCLILILFIKIADAQATCSGPCSNTQTLSFSSADNVILNYAEKTECIQNISITFQIQGFKSIRSVQPFILTGFPALVKNTSLHKKRSHSSLHSLRSEVILLTQCRLTI